MTAIRPRILLIEDDVGVSEALTDILAEEGFEPEVAHNATEGVARAQAGNFDVVLTDLQMPGLTGFDRRQGLQVIRALRASRPHLPVILMTAHHSTDIAIEAAKAGAVDYTLKPVDPPELLSLLRSAVRNKQAASEPVDLGESPSVREALLGRSPSMQEVYKAIGRVAATTATVLIRGETGTGKELVARALYQHSARSGRPLIVVNCAALPETLLESELFGHEPGAFTDAKWKRIGRFEQAHRGTIFLDEIGDMSLGTQVKLLRVLQEKTVQRLGGRETIEVDTRVLAATHRDLELSIREGTFRPDLYFRIHDAVVHLPPLRDRPEDIPELAQHFLDQHQSELGRPKVSLAPEALVFLQGERWPGNARELRAVIRRAAVLARGAWISGEVVRAATLHLKEHRERAPESATAARATEPRPFERRVTELLDLAQQGRAEKIQAILVEESERELFSLAIRASRGNQSRAAEWLGVSRPTMREKLIVYGLMAASGHDRPDPVRPQPRVLLVEDQAVYVELLRNALESDCRRMENANTVADALSVAQREEFDVVLADLRLCGPNGLELLERLRLAAPRLPVILMTSQHTTDTMIAAIKGGAYDYFSLPDPAGLSAAECDWNWISGLVAMIDRAAESKRVLERVGLPQDTSVGEDLPGDRMIGKSRIMRDVYREIGRVAATSLAVLIRGPTGTGKELVARAVHQHSGRAGEPFVVVNCAAVPETLLESELFGHEAGAFTDAKLRRIGRFEQAHRGSIFLDEIGDMSLSTQAKLLRVVQEKTIQRLGGQETIEVNVRILAATHRDLEGGIEYCTFRSDLYFRLSEAVIRLPALQDRPDDIPELAHYFVRRDGAELGWPNSFLTAEAVTLLCELPWPGNIRELRNVIRRALLMARGYPITATLVRKALLPGTATSSRSDPSLVRHLADLIARARRGQLQEAADVMLDELERELYTQAIARTAGDQSLAARWLGVSRPTMREKLAHYNITPASRS